MISREVVINNTLGLHARPAMFFIQKANSYPCSVWIEKDDRLVNAKSLLGVLSMGITKGTEVFIRKVAPLGDPMEVTVRGYELSLRKADTEMIEIAYSIWSKGGERW